MKAVEPYNLIYNTTVELRITTQLCFAVKPRAILYQLLFAVHNSIYYVCITMTGLRQPCYMQKILRDSFVQFCTPWLRDNKTRNM